MVSAECPWNTYLHIAFGGYTQTRNTHRRDIPIFEFVVVSGDTIFVPDSKYTDGPSIGLIDLRHLHTFH